MHYKNLLLKMGAAIISGVICFSVYADSTLHTSADTPNIPEIKSIELDGFYGSNPYTYTGTMQKLLNIDVDNDGEKEIIACYKGCCIEDSEKSDGSKRDNIDGFYDIYDENSDTPQTVYHERLSIHSHPETHIIRDDSTGKNFIGFINDSAYSFGSIYPTHESIVFDSTEQHDSYLKNMTFLDEVAYGKGDVDGDADITISDATAMLSYYAENAAGLPTEINDIQENAADMDKDGEITISDATTALSLYAEHAAGIIDTPILPSSVHFDGVNQYDGYYSLTTGDLESVFYLDIDNDGAKESVGRYINTNLENTFAMHSAPYVYQVYDNGRFVDTYGLNTGIYRTQFVLISDHNINETYIACLTEGGIASDFHFAVIDREYPKLSSVMEYDFFEEGNETFRMGNDLTDVDRAEFLEYISNLEIIDPYGDVTEDLYLFKYHRFLT